MYRAFSSVIVNSFSVPNYVSCRLPFAVVRNCVHVQHFPGDVGGFGEIDNGLVRLYALILRHDWCKADAAANILKSRANPENANREVRQVGVGGPTQCL